MQRLTLKGFLIRWWVACCIVLITYNPSPFCYVRWLLMQGYGEFGWKLLVGCFLMIIFSIYWHASRIALGKWGVVMICAIFVLTVYNLNKLGWINPEEGTVLEWLALLIISTVMTLGVSWSHLNRRLSGQLDVDYDEE